MKKYLLDLTVTEKLRLHANCVRLKMTLPIPMPEIVPGQFAELRVDNSSTAFLRRPLSIHYVDREQNQVWFLIQLLGAGSNGLARVDKGDKVSAILPLGNGFTLPSNPAESPLLVGGGVGVAPLLFLGKELMLRGIHPTFLLGARTADDLFGLEHFANYGTVCTTTEDGSGGEQGFVTQHSLLSQSHFDRIYACGPRAMMEAMAAYAKQRKIACEVSLENRMACGLGACLCCVENTVEGNLCVCKEGPVFDINRLLWQI